MKRKIIHGAHILASLILLWISFASAKTGFDAFFVPVFVIPLFFITFGAYLSVKDKKPMIGFLVTALPLMLILLSAAFAPYILENL